MNKKLAGSRMAISATPVSGRATHTTRRVCSNSLYSRALDVTLGEMGPGTLLGRNY